MKATKECPHCRREYDAWMDREIPLLPDGVKAHMDGCRECSQYRLFRDGLQSVLASPREERLSPFFQKRLMEGLPKQEVQALRLFRWVALWFLAVLAGYTLGEGLIISSQPPKQVMALVSPLTVDETGGGDAPWNPLSLLEGKR